MSEDSSRKTPEQRVRLAKPWLDHQELNAVAKVLDSGMLVQGEQVAAFEAALAKRCGRRFAIACSSGTSALDLALMALDVEKGHRVACPDLTWPSPAHVAAARGAQVVLADVCEDEWNSGPEHYEACGDVDVAIVIDQFGNPVQAEALAEQLGDTPIIEDAACGIGSLFADGKPCGSFGLISTLSFHPRKVLTTGEGGACLTDDEQLAKRIRILRNHGVGEAGFVEPAGNHRLGEINAAIGLVQMNRLDAMVEVRKRQAERYRKELPMLRFQRAPAGSSPNHQTIAATLAKGSTLQERDGFVSACRTEGIEVGRLSFALHRLPSLESAIAPPKKTSALIADTGFALPAFHTMTEDEQSRVIEVVARLVTR